MYIWTSGPGIDATVVHHLKMPTELHIPVVKGINPKGIYDYYFPFPYTFVLLQNSAA